MKKLLRMGIVFGCLLSLSTCGTTLQTEYKPDSFANFGGYSSKGIGENQFEIKANSNGVTRRGFAIESAMMRSAEIALENGFTHFRVLVFEGDRSFIKVGGSSPSFAGESVEMTIMLVNGQNQVTTTKCFPGAVQRVGTVCHATTVKNALQPRLMPVSEGESK